jgi:PAS domain S-box-containing protein
MRQDFRNLPIARKLTLVVLVTTSIVLLLSCAAFTAYELLTYKQNLVRTFSSTAQIIGANCSASLTFDVPTDAREILSALRAERQIEAAAVYRQDGSLFAKFSHGAQVPTRWEEARSLMEFQGGRLILASPIIENGAQIGTCYLRVSLEEMYQRLRLYGLISIAVLAGAFVVAFLLSRSLQHIVTLPIIELGETAKRVSSQRDYSVRARKFGDDELGLLTDAFNQMLGQVHERDLALRESEERYRSLVAATTSVVWTTNAEGSFATPQPSWEAYTGQGWKEYSGWGWLQAVHPDDRKSLEFNWRMAVTRSTIYDAVGRLWHAPTETYRHFSARAVPLLHGDGSVREWVGTVTDVDDRKRAEEKIQVLNAELEQRVLERTEQLAESNRELEAFTYSVSHDLRAPLRHIVAFGNLLYEDYGDKLETQAKDYLQRMIQGARYMGQLVDALLNLARVGRQELVMQVTYLNSLVDEIVLDLKFETTGRDVEWRIEPLGIAECDPGLIKQVFVNLLSNAVKYTRTKPKAIIEIGRRKERDEDVFFVRDNGVGFSMKYVDKLFGVFQRLHRPEDFEGTGVGLATVQRIILKHGGRVWVEAELDKGAAFYFTLQPPPAGQSK